MIKYVIYIALFCILLACEEIYIADFDESEPLIVVDATLTNEPQKNRVRLYHSYGFYKDRLKNPANYITGAEVVVKDEAGNKQNAQELGSGEYWFDFQAKPGEKYKLYFKIEDDEYESDYELMPPYPEFNNFQVLTESIEEYTFSPKGIPVKRTDLVCRLIADISIKDSLKHHRFNATRILEYAIFRMFSPHTFFWKTYYSSGLFDLTKLPAFSEDEVIQNYSVCTTKNDLETLISEKQYLRGPRMVGWIVNVEHYGISEKTFRYYEVLNEQMEAEGKLFDPVYPQIESNIHCISNPGKPVIGFFEVSSYKQRRFFVDKHRGGNASVIHFETDKFYNIPPYGELTQNHPPDFWLDSWSAEID